METQSKVQNQVQISMFSTGAKAKQRIITSLFPSRAMAMKS